ncbi:MAG: SpoIIE family protein phosphatase, partial [Bacteroidota bacterium]
EERKHDFIQQESYLNQALQQIDQIYFNIHDSLNYAKRFQEATLPRVESIKQKFDDSFILLKPKEVVSGDFYWFQQIEEDKILIAALDCTGHGVPGAFMAMLGNELLDSIVNRQKIYEPHVVLKELHRGVRMFLRQAENNNRDGMDGAVCLIDKQQMILEYAGAHNPILVIQNQEALLLSPNTFAIGGYEKEGERNFTKQSLALHPGATMYLYTDGYHDQVGGPDHRRFMASRLRRMLCKLYHKPMPEQKKILDKVIEYWMKGKPQLDDMLIMGLRI